MNGSHKIGIDCQIMHIGLLRGRRIQLRWRIHLVTMSFFDGGWWGQYGAVSFWFHISMWWILMIVIIIFPIPVIRFETVIAIRHVIRYDGISLYFIILVYYVFIYSRYYRPSPLIAIRVICIHSSIFSWFSIECIWRGEIGDTRRRGNRRGGWSRGWRWFTSAFYQGIMLGKISRWLG